MAGEDPMIDDPLADPMAEEMDPLKQRRPMGMARKAKAQPSRNKGYNNVAVQTADEEDAPFGEQQDSLEGNDPSPAGNMDGDREDETFNVSFATVVNEVRGMKAALAANGITVKSVTPGVNGFRKGRDQGDVLVRDVEIMAKTRSWKELNALREQVGDLPRHMING